MAVALLGMSPVEFSRVFAGSPMKRAKLRELKRNAAVVLGGMGSESDVPALAAVLADPEPLVRRQVAWALRQIGSLAALAALRDRLPFEDDATVADGLRTAITALDT